MIIKTLVQKFGVVVFWLTWPVTYALVKGTVRTRVLIVSGDEALLAKVWHGTGQWGLPGGGVDEGESLEEAAVREVGEEVGVQINSKDLRNLGQKKHRVYGIPYTGQYYLIQLDERCNAVAKMPEISEIAWVNVGNTGGFRLGEDSKHALLAYKALIQ